MRMRPFIGVATFITFCATAGTARAALTVRSATVSGESGSSWFFAGSGGGGDRYPYGPEPFPNDDRNFARVGPDGLRVLFNRTATFSGNTHIGSMTRSWSEHGFNVVFDIDEPSAFTFHRPFTGDFSYPMPVLQAVGQPPVSLSIFDTPTTGVLPPGRYGYSLMTNLHQGGGPPNGPFSFRADYRDMLLTVAPEPAALTLLIAPLVWMCGRRSPRKRATGVDINPLR
jgi:hypothetical protein